MKLIGQMNYETCVYHLGSAYGSGVKHVKRCIERLALEYKASKDEITVMLLSRDDVLRQLPEHVLNNIYYHLDRDEIHVFANYKSNREEYEGIKDFTSEKLTKKDEKLITDIAKYLPKLYKKIKKAKRKAPVAKRAQNQNDTYSLSLKKLFSELAKPALSKYMTTYNNKMARSLSYNSIYTYLPRQRLVIDQINSILSKYDPNQEHQIWMAQRLSYLIRFLKEAVTTKQRKEIYDHAKKLGK